MKLGEIWAWNDILMKQEKIPTDFALLFSYENLVLFETEFIVRYSNILFWEKVKNALESLQNATKCKFAINIEKIKDTIIRLVNRNKFFTGAKVKLIMIVNLDKNLINLLVIPWKLDKNFKFVVNRSKNIIIEDTEAIVKEIDQFTMFRSLDIHRIKYINTKLSKSIWLPIVNPNSQIIELLDMNFILISENMALVIDHQFGAYYNYLQQEILDALKVMDFNVVRGTTDLKDLLTWEEVWLIKDNVGIFINVSFKGNKFLQTSRADKIIKYLNSKIGFITD